jgi:DNA polymerase-3 subunit alpha
VIRFGLTTIKNFGEGIAEEIVEERKTHGPFRSVAEFLARVPSKNLNKKSLEALIMTGCFDTFETRGTLIKNLELLLTFHKEHASGKEAAQDSLFGGLGESAATTLTLDPAPDATTAEKLRWEKELLGVYVSGHPLDTFTEELTKRPSIGRVRRDSRNGIPVVTAGMVESVRELLTKKGEKMAFVLLADKEDTIELVAFPETYRENHELFIPGTCVAVKGRLSIRNDEPTIALERAKLLGDMTATV